MLEFNIPSQVWFPVVTLVAGTVLKGIFDALADKRTRLRERETRYDQRRDANALRRAEFQRTTLLELQETVSQLARATGQIHHHDRIAFRESGVWRQNLVPEVVDDGYLLATTRIGQLRVRVRDEQIRELAKDFTGACADAGYTRNEAEANAKIETVLELHQRLMERLGTVLRAIDEDEDRYVADGR